MGTNGKPNAIYFSGDTIYVEEAARGLREKWNVAVALLNLGRAKVPLGEETAQITMDGAQAAKLFRQVPFLLSTSHVHRALQRSGIRLLLNTHSLGGSEQRRSFQCTMNHGVISLNLALN